MSATSQSARPRHIVAVKRPPAALVAEMGLYTDGKRGGVSERWMRFEGAAAVHRDSVWIPGMIFQVRGTPFVHVVVGFHNEPGHSIRCYVPREHYSTRSERFIIDRLGWMVIPTNPTSKMILAALADFGTPASCG